MGLRSLYRFERFDAYNTPVYGEKWDVRSSHSRGYVFQHGDGTIYALSSSGSSLRLLRFDPKAMEFKTMADRRMTPQGRSLAGFIDPQGKLHVFHASGDGAKLEGAGDRPPLPKSSPSRDKNDVPLHHQKDYVAFDGTGHARDPHIFTVGPTLFHAQFSDKEMTTLEKNDPVDVESRNRYFKFGCPALTMAHYDRKTKIPQVVGANQIGLVRVFRNVSPTGVDITGWRTQPGLTTWGGETKPCLIANDENNEFRRFFRVDNQNVVRGDVLRLETGEAIRAHDKRFAGQWGRSKIVPVDWDLDGKIDLMVGTGRAQSLPGPGGMPDNLDSDDRQACVLFLRNVGSNAEPKFAYPVRMQYQGEPIKLGTHSCSPAAVDLGRGVLDLVVARENGKLMYYNREDLEPLTAEH